MSGAPPLRLGLVTAGFATSNDDWSVPALVDLVRALAETNDVRLVALRHPSRRPPFRVGEATVLATGGGTALPALLRGSLRGVATLVAEHRRRPFDLLHAFFAGEPAAVAVAAGMLLGLPVVVSILGGELESHPEIGYGGALGRVTRWLAPAALGRADLVTVGSDHVRRAPPSSLSSREWRRAPLGVATNRFFPAPAPRLAGAPSLLSVGALTPVKDHAGLFEAFAQLLARFPDSRLHLAGDGPLRAPLAARAAAPGLAGRVAFLGDVRHDALPDLYRGADLVVVSSRFESQSMAALEAAACATPLAGTAVGLLPCLVPGQVVPPGRPKALGELLLRLLSDRERLVAEARRLAPRVAGEYGIDASLARFREVHDEAIARAAARSGRGGG